jgi:hypothetical protein
MTVSINTVKTISVAFNITFPEKEKHTYSGIFSQLSKTTADKSLELSEQFAEASKMLKGRQPRAVKAKAKLEQLNKKPFNCNRGTNLAESPEFETHES